MAQVHRLAKPQDYLYGDVWNKYWWVCGKCGVRYDERWRARECCGGN